MFTWVCPTCGKELDVSTSECPECRNRISGPSPAARRDSNARFWLLWALGAAAGVAAIIALVRFQGRPRAGAPGAVSISKAQDSAAPAPDSSTAPPALIAPEIEIAGIRTFYDDKDKPQVRVILINHGDEPVSNLVLSLALRSRDAAPGSPPLARFNARVSSELKAGDSREIKAPLEAFGTLASLPPWRLLRADIEPPAAGR